METKGDSLIRLKGVKKVFYTDEVETHALDDVHLDIAEGEYIAIAGPSGCGKTTLLSLLGLLDSPTSGEYTLAGESVAELDASQRAFVRNRRIGFIFQAFNLIGDLTVYENVELPLTYRKMPIAERKERVHDALERVPCARPDLSVDGIVEIARLDDVLYTGRPTFGQANSTVGLFKLVENGSHAERVQVRLGRTSVNAVQIISGLDVGDIVILSDMSRWDDADRVRLR